jgi:hypothetical protein
MGHNIILTLGNPSEQEIGTQIWVHCAKPKCGAEWSIGLAPMPVDTFAAAVKAKRCPSCGGRKAFMNRRPRSTEPGKWQEWPLNHDMGVSSATMWAVLSGRPFPMPHSTPSVPGDAGDFGRCYRLLKVMPEWTARLSEVATAYPAWAPIVGAWSELTKLFEAEDWTGFAALMKQIRVAE